LAAAQPFSQQEAMRLLLGLLVGNLVKVMGTPSIYYQSPQAAAAT
jgi:hypothetical protein